MEGCHTLSCVQQLYINGEATLQSVYYLNCTIKTCYTLVSVTRNVIRSILLYKIFVKLNVKLFICIYITFLISYLIALLYFFHDKIFLIIIIWIFYCFLVLNNLYSGVSRSYRKKAGTSRLTEAKLHQSSS